jgi:PAT family acetyl-CoA transporter-like MFS transporter 1
MTEVKNSKSQVKYNAALLVFLYSLQGLVIGLLLETLQLKLKQGFTYSEIGVYLLCSYPFSLKIFWAAIVDTYYLKMFGLRKTWAFFTQIAGGIILIYLSFNINEIIHNKEIVKLAFVSFLLMFAVATQDIAVDGWALSLFGKDVKKYFL